MAVTPTLRVAARVGAATVGAYAVTAGAAALLAMLLVALTGMSRSDALIVGSSLAYILFAALMLWCFAERRLGRVWLVLLAVALATHGAAVLIERGLPVTGGAA